MWKGASIAGHNREETKVANKIRVLAVIVVGSTTPLAMASADSTQGAASPSPASPNSKFAKQPGSLSDKLDASNGVIRPKEVDPAIENKPPSTGTGAVIEPPGSPGGPQGVQPK